MFDASIAPERLDDCLAVITTGLDVELKDVFRIDPQDGGLFNYLLRIETRQGSYFFKQYLDDVPNPTYDPPAIPAARRCELACEVQRLAVQAMRGTNWPVVPEIMYVDRQRSAFVMTEAAGDEPLNDYFSRGERPESFLKKLPRVLAELHRSTFGRFEPGSLFGNTLFRDFKLGLQYDDIAVRLNSVEADRVLACRAAYQDRTDCVTHGDINSRNIIAADAALGVIDFEQSHLGTPAYDLSYILCELLISMETFGAGSEVAPIFGVFLDHYFEHFDAASRESVETEMSQHLAIQTLYRFWGPSRAAWTFYVDDPTAHRVIDSARTLLMRDGPVTALLGQLR